MNENNGTPASTEEEQVVETTEETTEEETKEESIEDLKSRLAKAEEEKENQKRRAEKAEKKAKTVQKPASDTNLSQNDVIYLAKSDIHEDDIAYVTDYAQKFGISVKEAHKQTLPILNQRKEERTTAEVTATKSPRGVKPRTGEDMLKKAEETGELPTGDDAMQELILARQNRMRRKE